jgi:hypothetical protein
VAVGARALWGGGSPYSAVGPGRSFAWDFPLLYPLPAVVAATPLAWLHPRLADAIFVGLGGFVLAWVLTRSTVRNPQLLVFVSAAIFTSAQTAQWSPLLTAAALTPSLGWLFACKPTIGGALWLHALSGRAAVLAAAFTLTTIILWPWWLSEWLAGLATASHMRAPIQQWGGPLILLGLLKWKRPEARLLVGLACVPQTPTMYEAVPLFLLVRRLDEGLLLVALMVVSGEVSAAISNGADYLKWMRVNGQVLVALVYLPCLLMVLRRPNESTDDPQDAGAPSADSNDNAR